VAEKAAAARKSNIFEDTLAGCDPVRPDLQFSEINLNDDFQLFRFRFQVFNTLHMIKLNGLDFVVQLCQRKP
jgi:hypothetical protein